MSGDMIDYSILALDLDNSCESLNLTDNDNTDCSCLSCLDPHFSSSPNEEIQINQCPGCFFLDYDMDPCCDQDLLIAPDDKQLYQDPDRNLLIDNESSQNNDHYDEEKICYCSICRENYFWYLETK